MTRNKLLKDIKYAMEHINYDEKREKEWKKAFKKLKQDLKCKKKLELFINILRDYIYLAFDKETGDFFIKPYDKAIYSIGEISVLGEVLTHGEA